MTFIFSVAKLPYAQFEATKPLKLQPRWTPKEDYKKKCKTINGNVHVNEIRGRVKHAL